MKKCLLLIVLLNLGCFNDLLMNLQTSEILKLADDLYSNPNITELDYFSG
ncbi:MAG: hypothetical protein ACI8YQ_001307 [Polaribacter sp.]|jgi:hypothetical protein